MKRISDIQGRAYDEGHPDYEKVRLDNTERQLRELTLAVADLQHRLAEVDDGEIDWPASVYEPKR